MGGHGVVATTYIDYALFTPAQIKDIALAGTSGGGLYVTLVGIFALLAINAVYLYNPTNAMFIVIALATLAVLAITLTLMFSQYINYNIAGEDLNTWSDKRISRDPEGFLRYYIKKSTTESA